MINRYKTQNVTFDEYVSSVKVLDYRHLVQTIGKLFESHGVSNQSIVRKALKKEQQLHGFSIVNETLICNANISSLTARKTMLIKLDTPKSIDLGQGPQLVSLVACTVSAVKLGVLNLRYLSRLTRMFSDEDLVENLKAVNSVDGMKILLNDGLIEDIRDSAA